MDSRGTPSGSRRPNSRVPNISIPNTSSPQTGVYRPQMPSPTGFANWSPPDNYYMQPPVDWAYMNMMSQNPMNFVPSSQQSTMQPPPSQVWEPRDGSQPSPTWSGGDDDDAIPETQPSPPPSPQQNKRKTRGKGKKAATTSEKPTKGKAACKAWTVDEEVALAKSWAEISEDPTIVDNFWGAVKLSFDTRMGYNPNIRSNDAMQTKTRMLLSGVAKFACIYNNTLNTRKSGESDVDVLTRAKGRYRNELHKSFPHENAWNVLKESPKFVAVEMMNPSDIRAPTNKRSKTSETVADSPGESDARTYVNVGGNDEPSQTERPRPMGRNAARRAASSSTTAATTETNTVLASQIGALATANTGLYDALCERQRGVDFQFYTSPHNHLSGQILDITLQEKERIRLKYGWAPLDS